MWVWDHQARVASTWRQQISHMIVEFGVIQANYSNYGEIAMIVVGVK